MIATNGHPHSPVYAARHAVHAPGAARLPGWQSRLAAYLRTRARQPLVWGVNDCALFAAGAVHAITGRAVPMPAYSGPRAGLRTIRALGGLAAAATRELGEPIAPQLATVGDVVLMPAGRRHVALAVCNGATALAPSSQGTAAYPMRAAIAAWRV